MDLAKLYFKYGVVNSSKSANALMTIHNYEEQGMSVYLIKSSVDTRDGAFVKSRAVSTARKIDLLLDKDSDIQKLFNYDYKARKIDVIIVDECQFLTVNQINGLRGIVDTYNIPVICYGLKTDFRTQLFDSSKRLIEIADSISEVKTVCSCGSKAIFNAKVGLNGDLTTAGNQITIGDKDIYVPLCSKCYHTRVPKIDENKVNESVLKSFLSNKDYLEGLVKRINKSSKEERGIVLNEIVCADYYLSRLMKCDLSIKSELLDLKRCFESILESEFADTILTSGRN